MRFLCHSMRRFGSKTLDSSSRLLENQLSKEKESFESQNKKINEISQEFQSILYRKHGFQIVRSPLSLPDIPLSGLIHLRKQIQDKENDEKRIYDILFDYRKQKSVEVETKEMQIIMERFVKNDHKKLASKGGLLYQLGQFDRYEGFRPDTSIYVDPIELGYNQKDLLTVKKGLLGELEGESEIFTKLGNQYGKEYLEDEIDYEIMSIVYDDLGFSDETSSTQKKALLWMLGVYCENLAHGKWIEDLKGFISFPAHTMGNEHISSHNSAQNYPRNLPTPANDFENLSRLTLSQRLQLGVLTILGAITRLKKIDYPSYVVFDEEYVGGLINSYIKGELFVDSSPPLIVMVYSNLAKYFNYGSNGTFMEFLLGNSYLSINNEYYFPYISIRGFSAICNMGLILFTYKLLRSSGVRHSVSLFGSFLVLTENSMLTHSRLMLFESLFLLSIGICLMSFYTGKIAPRFGLSWFINLFISAIALSFALSSHWCGLLVFMYLMALLLTEFWDMAGNLNISNFILWSNTLSKLFTYLSISITVYLSVFFYYFENLQSKGPAYDLLSPGFQFALKNNHIDNLPRDVHFGSTVMIRHYKTGKYLHSHNENYRSGHQQVTMFDSFDDTNNYFFIETADSKKNQSAFANKLSQVGFPFKMRLYHNITQSNLIIDGDRKPPISEQDYNKEVTTDNNIEPAEDQPNEYEFQFKIQKDYTQSDIAKTRLRSLETVFQIYNNKQDCYILGTAMKFSSGMGKGQNEVICIKDPTVEQSLWYIDHNTHPLYDSNTTKIMIPDYSFWQKFIEIHKLIWRINSGVSEEEHNFASRPIDWLTLRRGVGYWRNESEGGVIYLLGNFITYHLILLAILMYIIFKIYQIVTFNPYATSSKAAEDTLNYDIQSFNHVLGIIITFVPLLFLKKSLFLSNYFPSLFFGILLLSQSFEILVGNFLRIGYTFLILSSGLITLALVKFLPIIYGTQWTTEACTKLMVNPGWDRDICNVYN